jgi:NADH:ubiquinone oxidoreductase subunit K
MKITREWITPITTGAFLLTAVTGVLLFFHAATGLNKAVHEWLSWIFLAGAVLHLVLNFTAFKKYLTQRRGQVLLGLFVLILALSFAPVGGGHHHEEHNRPFVPPIKALAQAPLTTLAQVARISPEQLRERLTGAGVAVSSDQQSISELVGDDFRAQLHLLEKLLAGRQ